MKAISGQGSRSGWQPILAGLAALVLAASSVWPCTLVVVSGKATRDGRPLLWKNRDVEGQDSLVRYFSGRKYAFLGIVDAGFYDEVYAGINAAGLAFINSVSEDMEGTAATGNGEFIKKVLEECASVNDVEALLRSTNGPGRKTQANFGVIDAQGNGAIFETGNTTFTKYDVDEAPLGFIVRTNFAQTGTKPEQGGGFVRFARATDLLTRAAEMKILDHRFLLEQAARDLANESIDPYPLPYRGSQNNHSSGYVYTANSINRYLTACCTVFHGVRPGEDPLLATMWCILGEPVCGIALPLWVKAGAVPTELGGSFTAPLRDAVKLKERRCYSDPLSDKYLNTLELADGRGNGLIPFIGRIEIVLFRAAEAALSGWRRTGADPARVLLFEDGLASWAFRKYLFDILR
jgi:hypothetical protein